MTAIAKEKYTSSHEWVCVKEDGKTVRIGITDYYQSCLSDVISVELPEPEDRHRFEADEEFGAVEAINTTAELRMPVAGVIVAINTDLLSNPELINSDPHGRGWLVEVRPANMADLNELMEADEYELSLPEEEEEE